MGTSHRLRVPKMAREPRAEPAALEWSALKPSLLERCCRLTAPAPGHARRDAIRRIAEPHGLQRGAHGDAGTKRTASHCRGTTGARRGVARIELVVPVFDAGRPTGRDRPLQAATDVPASKPLMRALDEDGRP